MQTMCSRCSNLILEFFVNDTKKNCGLIWQMKPDTI